MDAKTLTLTIEGEPVTHDQMHRYEIRFVKTNGVPDLSLYRDGLRVSKSWSFVADVTVEPTSCTAPG